MPALPYIDPTAIDAAQDALLEQIRTRVGADIEQDVPVDLGFPVSGVQPQHIWIDAHVDDEDQIHAVSGLGAKDETFTLRVRMIVTWTAAEYREARNQCTALATSVINAVRDDYTLGGAVMLATIGSVEPDQAMPGEGKHQAGATVRVSCRAWLA